MTANDSSTGGYLVPNPPPSPQPVEDSALVNFFQAIVVGLTGFTDPTLVRPRWQPQMPIMPDIATDWIALGINDRPSDTFAAVSHQPSLNSGNGADVFGRNETLEILISVYGPNADTNATLIRDGLSIAQNREVLQLVGMGLVEVTSPKAIPPLYNAQWYYRLDMKVYIRRLVLRTYPILNIESILGTVTSANAKRAVLTVPFLATQE